MAIKAAGRCAQCAGSAGRRSLLRKMRCFSVKTIRPHATHGIVNRVTDSFYAYQAWPTLARDEKGTLYAVASGFRVRHVCPFGKTVLYISHDAGRTWTPPVVINDTHLDDRDAGILYLGNGKLLISWFTRSAEEYQTPKYEALMAKATPAGKCAIQGAMEAYRHLTPEQKKTGSYVRLSRDYGVTWDAPCALPVTAPHGPAMCNDGSLVYLGSVHKPIGSPGDADIRLYRSRDEGKNWDYVSTIAPPVWLAERETLCEPHIIQLPDGRLLGAVRVEGRTPYTIATAYSVDDGKTWSDLVCTHVSGAPPHLMRHSSGALICTFGRREPPYGQQAMVSHDLGQTWDELYLLDDNTDSRDLGYGSTVELDDGSLITVYYQRCPGDDYPSILYTKWQLS